MDISGFDLRDVCFVFQSTEPVTIRTISLSGKPPYIFSKNPKMLVLAASSSEAAVKAAIDHKYEEFAKERIADSLMITSIAHFLHQSEDNLSEPDDLLLKFIMQDLMMCGWEVWIERRVFKTVKE